MPSGSQGIYIAVNGGGWWEGFVGNGKVIMNIFKLMSAFGLLGSLSSAVWYGWSMINGNENADRSGLIALLALVCLTALWAERLYGLIIRRRTRGGGVSISSGARAGLARLMAWTSAVSSGGAIVVSILVIFPGADLVVAVAVGLVFFGLPMFLLEKNVAEHPNNGGM